MIDHQTFSQTRAEIIAAALDHYLNNVLNDSAGVTEDGKHCIDLLCLFDVLAESLEEDTE
jgi:hypothetical protein